MEYLLNIVAHSANLKQSPTGSKDTGIFFPPDLITFLGGMQNLEFVVYKEDCIKAVLQILDLLPLYSNKGGVQITHNSKIKEFEYFSSIINSFFGNNETRIYKGFKPSQTTQSRCYLYGLDYQGFNIRHFLVSDKCHLLFKKNANSTIDLRIIYNEEILSVVPLKISSPLQKIFYGAPGTGKSFSIKNVIADHMGISVDKVDMEADYIFRTTFHPDYDYAQFVGCYKPTKDSNGNITYEFIPQVFINALVKAYENINAANNSQQTPTSKEESEIPVEEIPEKENENEANSMSVQPVYLVIEEINRGNCAQIFGDIFQLLDRDANGVSEYSISVDRDLREYLENNCPNAICNGKIKLPANLSIIATMNTSDQSLFPMDSAFKRRWEWEYVKIENNTNFEIEVDATHKYSWKDFQNAVNQIIRDKTHSEDKQMGDYFIKKNVSLNEFVNKVMFYLWNDVCKENYHTEDNFFRTKEDVNTEEEIEFSFGEMIDDKENKIIGFMNYLGVENQFKSVNQNNGAVVSNSPVTNVPADQTEGSLNPE